MSLHDFDRMTEPQLARLMNKVAKRVSSTLPPETGFIVLAAPYGPNQVAQYVANGERECCIKWLRETADRLESRDDVQRQPWT